MDHDPEKLEAAIKDLRRYLVDDWEWGKYPRDRGTVPYEDTAWGALESYAKTKYGEADRALKAAIKEQLDQWEPYRKFTAFDEEERQHRMRERPHSVEPGYVLGELRTDGLYRASSTSEDSCWYLRFYADGTVLQVVSTGDAQQISSWFNKSKHFGYKDHGEYSRSGGSITFTIWETEYDGTVGVDEIRLTQFYRNTGYSAERIYSFVPVSGEF